MPESPSRDYRDSFSSAAAIGSRQVPIGQKLEELNRGHLEMGITMTYHPFGLVVILVTKFPIGLAIEVP